MYPFLLNYREYLPVSSVYFMKFDVLYVNAARQIMYLIVHVYMCVCVCVCVCT